MVSDIDQLVRALHRDPPEQVLKDEIRKRRVEILDRLREGKSYELRDVLGRVVRISARPAEAVLREKQPA